VGQCQESWSFLHIGICRGDSKNYISAPFSLFPFGKKHLQAVALQAFKEHLQSVLELRLFFLLFAKQKTP